MSFTRGSVSLMSSRGFNRISTVSHHFSGVSHRAFSSIPPENVLIVKKPNGVALITYVSLVTMVDPY